jgi:hypothetical protein
VQTEKPEEEATPTASASTGEQQHDMSIGTETEADEDNMPTPTMSPEKTKEALARELGVSLPALEEYLQASAEGRDALKGKQGVLKHAALSPFF